MNWWVKPAVAALFCGVLWVLFQEGLALERKIVATAAIAAYALILLRYNKACLGEAEGESGAGVDYLVAYATETGTARQIARQTCKTIRENGLRASLVELNRLVSSPRPSKGLLVIASTTGNGDAPRTGDAWQEEGGSFLRNFASCSYAVLALGDRSYSNFCGFGLQVAAELQQAGAVPLFEPVLVHQGDPASVNYWFRQLSRSAVPARR
ncbi:flavodoxin domain-containing protein [Marinobacter sp. F3R11]|uniref:flavodoxin domain-containing protein n=1 Tax=Marinobacter sp. F3R11 TaxID=2267231 RepID=UPI000DEBC31B|nr:flavodoxin family protein [Marinobacter sp. F3R11]RBW49756.1 hypothetical protein DS878_05305 [Marinobacter sp. F3R11]